MASDGIMSDENTEKAPILACSWRDSGVVYFMSTTAHRGGNVGVVERQRSGPNTIHVDLHQWQNSTARTWEVLILLINIDLPTVYARNQKDGTYVCFTGFWMQHW